LELDDCNVVELHSVHALNHWVGSRPLTLQRPSQAIFDAAPSNLRRK
jgi:hypothetical protein